MTDLQTKWIEALRSGKYKQGKGRLRNGDKFCCLGVLCDIVDPTKWTYVEEVGMYVEEVGYKWNYKHTYRTSIEINYEVNLTGRDICYLSDINDNGGTFVEISDLLQKKFDGGVSFSDVLEKKFDEPILPDDLSKTIADTITEVKYS